MNVWYVQYMAAHFRNIDRATPILLPQDMREWVPEDDMVHFVIEAVERLPLESFQVNHRGAGSRQYPPRMLLALLIYCYCYGIFSSRKIERATYRDVAVRFLTGDTHPDHDTICTFRRRNKEAISAAFVDILQLAKELGVLKVGKVSVDGTHIKANASINKNVSYNRAKELKAKLEEDIAELMKQAEQADSNEEDTETLPAEIKRREALRDKMDKAMEELKERARKEQEKAQADYDNKQQEREEKEKQTGQKMRGAKPKPPEQDLEKFTEEINQTHNMTDSDSRVMRKSNKAGYTQSYNAQACVDAEGSQLVVGTHIAEGGNDKNELSEAYDSISEEVGKPTALLADAGYNTAACLTELESKVDLYVSVHREDAHNEREYDFRPKQEEKPRPKEPKNSVHQAMKAKLETPEGRSIYKLRSQTVETAFGVIKEAMGFRGFLLRGKEKVASEWELVCASYNLKRLFNAKKAI